MGRKRTQGSGSIIARANGRFTAQVSDTATGRRRSVGTFTTKAAAEKAIAHAIVEGPPPTLEVTFGAYLAEWLEDQALFVKATTAAKNRAMGRRVLREPIARPKVRDLKPEDFRRLYPELRDHGNTRSRSTPSHPTVLTQAGAPIASRRTPRHSSTPPERSSPRLRNPSLSDRPWRSSSHPPRRCAGRSGTAQPTR